MLYLQKYESLDTLNTHVLLIRDQGFEKNLLSFLQVININLNTTLNLFYAQFSFTVKFTSHATK